MTMPKTKDVRKSRAQTASAVSDVLEQGVRTPLLAALGASDLAAQALRGVVIRAREQVSERTEAARDLPNDLNSLRGRLGTTDLRKVIDDYTDAASKLYHKLAEHGEDALDKLRERPHIRRAIEGIEGAAGNAQQRVEDVAADARVLADDVLATLTRRTRSIGERTARTAERVSARAADAVDELGADVAHQARSTSRKVASRTTPARKSTGRQATGRQAAGRQATSKRSGAAKSSNGSKTSR